MSTMSDYFPPPTHRGMKDLDRSVFSRTIPLVVAQIKDPRNLTKVSKLCAPEDLLQMKKVTRIVQLPTESGPNNGRGILLSPRVASCDEVTKLLSPKTLEVLEQCEFTPYPYTLELNYDHWTADEILKAVLPADIGDVPTSFSMVGHIAHLNLRDEFLPYKYLIGQVIFDKNQPAIQTVVNKLDSISAVFRTFDMEVIAGKEDFMVEQCESGCRFQFDFRKVYWNSRLHTEHERLVKLFGKNVAVCDPFAGVGPFAIPAAKQNDLVFANDLNPNSYEAMVHNTKLNKVIPGLLHCYNLDARQFIRESVSKLHEFRKTTPVLMIPPSDKARRHNLAKPTPFEVPDHFSHYVMNLPATAIEFLDAFRGLYANSFPDSSKPVPAPYVHVHCFHKFDPHAPEPTKEEVLEVIAARISTAMKHTVDPKAISLHDVRRVAPAKDMYAASFIVPEEVLYATD